MSGAWAVQERKLAVEADRQWRMQERERRSETVPMPSVAMERAEELASGDVHACRAEAVNDFINWVMEVGPNPEPVLTRFFGYLLIERPELLGSFRQGDVKQVFAAAQRRAALVLLGKQYRSEGHFLPAAGGHEVRPLEVWLETEEGHAAEERGLRAEGLRRFVSYLLEVGDEPEAVMKRFYGYLRDARPECILNMNGSALALMFNEERATTQAREKKMLGELKHRAGYKTLKLPHHKSATVCGKYAESARGNSNRRKRAA